MKAIHVTEPQIAASRALARAHREPPNRLMDRPRFTGRTVGVTESEEHWANSFYYGMVRRYPSGFPIGGGPYAVLSITALDETATLPLEYSDAWLTVRKLRERTKFSQKDFCRLLRVDLAGVLPAGALLNVVKALDFSSTGTVTGRVDRNAESFGRSIGHAVQSERPIPEFVELEAPVYKTSGEAARYACRCAVEVDFDMQAFQLIPLPDEVERVEQAAMASARARLTEGLEDGVPAYYGKP